MKRKITPFVENIAESTSACLFMMVQGNLLGLTLSHWLIASETGIVAGIIASIAILLARTSRRWVVAIVLGLVTAVVDFFVHPGMFESVVLEAALTGLGAALLSLSVGYALEYIQTRRVAHSADR